MRNEKAVLVALSYVIGFTTAFIGFALTDTQTDHFALSGNVSDYVPTAASQKAHASEPLHIVFDETGMYADFDEKMVIISGKLHEGIAEGPGFHVEIPFYEVSPSGKYVYYCERETESDNVCNEYIYEANTHTSHTLQHDGQSFRSFLFTSNFDWTKVDIATYDTLVSLSENQPWKLVHTN